jgi:lipid-A-disaccharide synthase
MNSEEGHKPAAPREARPPKIMISAGESSGEIHGAALIKAARDRGLDWTFLGLGGDRMAAAGARLLAHINDTAVMGLSEVIGALPGILAIRASLKRSLELDRPSALVLIDAPDFNLPLARHAHGLGIPVIYYICPQVWAWRESRLKLLARYTDRRALLFDFEKRFYEERGLSADWVGHPIADELPPFSPRDQVKAELGFDPARRLLTLMPGSRRQVVKRLAPIFFQAADQLLDQDPQLNLLLPRADSISQDFLDGFLREAPARVRAGLTVVSSRSPQALAAADLAIVASGTSSVEAAFLGTPMLVAYRVSALSWRLGRLLIGVPYVSIANLVAGREIVPELLQERATAENLAEAAWPLLAGGPARAGMADALKRVRARLGGPGASGRVVDIIAEELRPGGPGR